MDRICYTHIMREGPFSGPTIEQTFTGLKRVKSVFSAEFFRLDNKSQSFNSRPDVAGAVLQTPSLLID